MNKSNNARVTAKVVEARLNAHCAADQRDHDRFQEALVRIGGEMGKIRERMRAAEVRLTVIVTVLSFLASLLSALLVKWM